jgi:beta-glucanase (GH16 family)
LAFKAKVRFEGAVPAGIVGSLFGYALNAAGTARDEIDVELLTTAPVGFLTNVYQAAGFSGAGTPQAVGSGSLTDFHTYEVDWFADHIVWLVDGTVVRTATSGIPTQPMTIRLNVWAPDSSFSQAFSAALAPVASPQQDQTYFYDVASVEIDRLSASVTRNRDFDRR